MRFLRHANAALIAIGLTAPATAQDITAPARFATLAQAVAAQDAAAVDAPVRCLASAVYFESQGQPLAGQLAVAQVIMHRTRSGRFPHDVCGVVTQRSQFSFVHGGVIPTIDAGRAAWRTAVGVAKVALAEGWSEQVEGALYFNAVRAAHSGAVLIAAIGGQAFYR